MTKYFVQLRWRATGNTGRLEFDSRIARSVALAGLAPFVDVIDQGETWDFLRGPRCSVCGSADLVYWTEDYSKCVACGVRQRRVH